MSDHDTRSDHINRFLDRMKDANEERDGLPELDVMYEASLEDSATLVEVWTELQARYDALAAAVKADWSAPHVVHLADSGWRLQHPLRCHDDLDSCRWNAYLDEYAYDMFAEKGPGHFEIVERMSDEPPELRACSPHRLALGPAVLASAAQGGAP